MRFFSSRDIRVGINVIEFDFFGSTYEINSHLFYVLWSLFYIVAFLAIFILSLNFWTKIRSAFKSAASLFADLVKAIAILAVGAFCLGGCVLGVSWSYQVTEPKMGAFFGVIAGIIAWFILAKIGMGIFFVVSDSD